MWPFDSYNARRKEIRREKLERLGAWYRRLLDRVSFGWTSVTVLTALIACIVVNSGTEPLNLRAGQWVKRGIPARVDFKIPDEQQTRERRVRARDASPNVYQLDGSLLEDVRARLANTLSIVRANKENPDKLSEELGRIKVALDDEARAKLLTFESESDNETFLRWVDAAIALLRTRPLVEPEGVGARRTSNSAILIDAGTGKERTVPITQLIYANDAEGVSRFMQDVARAFPEPLTRSLGASVESILRGGASGDAIRPIYRYDNERTSELARMAEAAVETQYLRFAADDVLANAGEIGPDEVGRLRAEHTAYQEYVATAGLAPLRLQIAARSLLTILIVLGVVAYASRYQREALRFVRRWALSAAVVVLMLAAARYIYVSSIAPAQAGVGAVALATALLAIVFPPGLVLAMSAGLAILTTSAVRGDIGYFIVLLAVTGVFVFGLRQVRNRGRIVIVGAIAGVVALVTTICVALVDGQTLAFSTRLGAWAGGATLLAGFIIEGLLPGIERLFAFSTGMTLLEWCDGSKPLLRMMAADAPGTYNHSLLVGTLAESAAESIGADGLLCRAGAYYHDIGKINKPEYFVENQGGGPSRHERLSPAMSLLIIVGHVKDGIEMAREYGLPADLRPFIAEHHGTTLVEYFYHAANRLRKPDDSEVAEAQYRYPGPKPQSRETAILMLADGVEGAVRAMSEPTPGRIEDVVSGIVRKRLMDGQFDECDLTLSDLAEIEKSLVKTLSSVYHARIVYPESDDEDEAKPVRSAS